VLDFVGPKGAASDVASESGSAAGCQDHSGESSSVPAVGQQPQRDRLAVNGELG